LKEGRSSVPARHVGLVAGNHPDDRLAMCGHHIREAVPYLPQKAREIADRLGRGK
jgi:hypothetical protein